MSKKILSILLALGLLATFFAAPGAAAPSQGDSAKSMPANEEKLQAALEARGVIPAGATAEQAQQIMQAYLQQKFNSNGSAFASPKDVPNPKASQAVKNKENKFTGNSLSSGPRVAGVPNAQALPLKKTAGTGKILAILVEFAAEPGPLAGNLPKPADTDKDYWVENFDRAHYEKMLFDKTPGANSLANFYLAQSDGLFTVEGGAYGWIKLPYPESYYGGDAETGGHDNANGPAWRVVKDAVKAAQEQGIEIPYKDFDADGDGLVDSLMVIHAGAGQEGGGGAQGDDAIWSHSWFVDYVHGGYETWDGTLVGPYTIEPEDGAVGVFAHEYGHQLGLPDLYDTTYAGESSTGFYTLMSSGSWNGKPLGTHPANLDIWSKMVLGWTPDLTTVTAGPSGTKDFFIHSDETYATFSKGFRVNLPNHDITTVINAPFAGSNEYWSTMGDDINTSMTRTVDLTGVASPVLKFKTWYNIEYDYDYGYIEVSTDNGATFTKLPGNITRDVDGVPSIDGTSGTTDRSNDVSLAVWTDAEFDLSAYAGKSIQLRFHYITDGGVAWEGWAIDNISIDGVFSDDAENPTGWTMNGFRQFAGTETLSKAHYYIGQLVRPVNSNIGLAEVYNYYLKSTKFERFEYEPGVLLWYRDTAFVDNNVGMHPGQGRVLIVDAHNAPMLDSKNVPFRTRIQVYDAPFGVEATSPLSIHDPWGVPFNFEAQPGVTVFDGTKSYYNSAAPFNSVITPKNNLKITVKGISQDGSAARIGVDYK